MSRMFKEKEGFISRKLARFLYLKAFFSLIVVPYLLLSFIFTMHTFSRLLQLAGGDCYLCISSLSLTGDICYEEASYEASFLRRSSTCLCDCLQLPLMITTNWGCF